MAMTEQEAYDALCADTLARRDAEFIHQHVVDAYMAQHADERTKAIGLTFALAGLYLHIERGFSGRQVQRVHMALAGTKQSWPPFALPQDRGSITVVDVLAASGAARDRAIHQWCASVWAAFRENTPVVQDLLQRNGLP
jgi:hypothetical protein